MASHIRPEGLAGDQVRLVSLPSENRHYEGIVMEAVILLRLGQANGVPETNEGAGFRGRETTSEGE